MLNPQKGNMYPWVTHTWNAIKGKCPHNCIYCYMKQYPQNDIRLDKEELKTDFGINKTIFVGSSCDMFAKDIPAAWIIKVLTYCQSYNDNIYLFQTKNPHSYSQYIEDSLFPSNIILGTTIESNILYKGYSTAPDPIMRYIAMEKLKAKKMISIEPIMDFDVLIMLRWIKRIGPEFVSIGADSKSNLLPEPHPDKIKSLISGLKEFTDVKLKSNLKRLINIDYENKI